MSCFRESSIYFKDCCCTIFNLKCCNNCTLINNSTEYKDDGCSCRRDPSIYFKKSYTRTGGKVMNCGKDQDQMGLFCYSKCLNNYYGFGSMCYLNCNNTIENKYDCGLFCAKDIDDCSQANRLMLRPIDAIVFFYNNKCESKFLIIILVIIYFLYFYII